MPTPRLSQLERLERFKGNAKFRRHQLVCVKRSLKLQEQVDREEKLRQGTKSSTSS